MITEELKELTRNEAESLKKIASKKELTRLSFEGLNATDPQRCIYGQMTGNCHSPRATMLIKKCCSAVESAYEKKYLPIDGLDRGDYFSPIEIYIMAPRSNKEGLIAYLKGETDTLEL